MLTKGGLVSNRRDGRNKRYFEPKKFSSTEMKTIFVLRHETAGIILKILHDDKSASHEKLAQHLNISSQALTWHIKQLKEEKELLEAGFEYVCTTPQDVMLFRKRK